jgi:hypothetical protein
MIWVCVYTSLVPEAKQNIRVFINYAREDIAWAQRLYVDLVQHGIEPWLDLVKLLPGQSWKREIRKAIREANFVITLISSRSVEKRGFVNAEIRECLDLLNELPEATVFMLPVRLEPCDPSFERLRELHWVDLFPSYEAGLEKLLRVMFNERPHKRNLTRVADASSAALGKGDIPKPTRGGLTAKQVVKAKATFRIDVLCFFDHDVLVLGSGHLDENSTRDIKNHRLVRQIEYRHPPTGMDGRFSDHKQTQRHVELGYHEIVIFDRVTGKSLAEANCDSYSTICSADWSPDGACVAVGSVNFLTIVKLNGDLLPKENYGNERRSADITSVAWQPSINPLFGSSSDVCVSNPEGKLIRKLAQMPASVTCVAIEPRARIMAAVDVAGDVMMFNEYGELIAQREGLPSLAGPPHVGEYAFHASRSLEFSSDSRFLAQCACTGGTKGGINIFDVRDGRTLFIDAPETNLLAWHPANPGILVSASADQITFWSIAESD